MFITNMIKPTKTYKNWKRKGSMNVNASITYDSFNKGKCIPINQREVHKEISFIISIYFLKITTFAHYIQEIIRKHYI